MPGRRGRTPSAGDRRGTGPRRGPRKRASLRRERRASGCLTHPSRAGTVAGLPEMPEMQAVAGRLAGLVAGRRFVSAERLSFSALKTVMPAPESLGGRDLRSVGRRGKYLIFDFGGPRRMA